MKLLTALLTTLLLFGCGSRQDPAPVPNAQQSTATTTNPAVAEVSFARDIQSLIAANCMPCHSGSSPKAGYDLTSYEGVTGNGSDAIPNAIAGKPDSSKLYQMLRDGRMPPTGKLDSAKIGLVYRWISEGAKNNSPFLQSAPRPALVSLTRRRC